MSFFGQITPAGLIAIRPTIGRGNPNGVHPARPGQEYTDELTGNRFVKGTTARFSTWFPVSVTGNPTTYYGDQYTATPVGVTTATGPAVWYGYYGNVYGKLDSANDSNWFPLLTFADLGINPVIPVPPTNPNVTLGLVNWWKFDENMGTTAADSAGSATATLIDDPAWVPGKINFAIDFSGHGYCSLAENTISGSSGFTFSSWLNPSNPSFQAIFYDSDNDNQKGFFIETGVTGSLFLRVAASISDLIRKTVNNVIPGNTWTHLLITWDGTLTDFTTVHIFTNATEVGYNDGSSVNGSGIHEVNTTTDRYIAHDPTGGSFAGIIDDVRIYNRVLTQNEINTLYQWRGGP